MGVLTETRQREELPERKSRSAEESDATETLQEKDCVFDLLVQVVVIKDLIMPPPTPNNSCTHQP